MWTGRQSRLKQIGVAAHEASEYIMIWKWRFNGNIAHWIANCLEYIVSLGSADLSWIHQNWKKRAL